MLRISRGTLSPALNTPSAWNWRLVAALTAIVVVAFFVGLSLGGSWIATSPPPEPAAINPPVVGNTTDGFGIPYQGTGPAADIIRSGTATTTDRAGATEPTGIPYSGTGPAAEIIRGTYRDEPAAPPAPVMRDTTAHTGIPYPGTGPAAEIIRSGSDTTNR